IFALLARGAWAVSPSNGGLTGLVEDTQGVPVAGAVISIFGKGLGGAGLIALSDSAGRFFLPSVPAGSYTLRALGARHLPAPARLLSSLVPDLAGTVEVMASPAEGDDGLEPSASYSVLRLKGRIANAGQWSLGGLVAESESASWRMAAEFVLEPGGGHKLQAG